MPIHSIQELLAKELATLGGHAYLADATTRGTEELLLLLATDREPVAETPAQPGADGLREVHLVLAFSQPLFWFEPSNRKRPYSGTGFGDWLRTQLRGSALQRVSAGTSGRVLRLTFRSLTLVLDPLPNACRILVLDEDGVVVQRFPPTLHQAPQGRGSPGSVYREPEGDFREPWQRAGSEPAQDCADLSPGAPLYVCQERATRDLLLSPLACDALSGEWTDLTGPLEAGRAAQWLARSRIRTLRSSHARRDLVRLLKAERKQLRRLATRIRREIEDASQGGTIRRQAEALLTQAGRVPRGTTRVKVEDPSEPGLIHEVVLDPARSFSDNVNVLFQKAGRLERARPVREAKAAHVDLLLTQLDEWLTAAEQASELCADALARSFAEITDRLKKISPDLDAGLSSRVSRFLRDLARVADGIDRPDEQRSHEARQAKNREGKEGSGKTRPAAGSSGEPGARLGIHPRRFAISDGWIALVGRSNRENDLLTHKLAKPRDLWFHARGVAGSHVILQRGGRKDNPSEPVLEAAAGIAAYYSKGRTSGLVPVIYTERRYVRKPRKAPPGLAVCLREKVLMVEPKLPAGTEGAEE